MFWLTTFLISIRITGIILFNLFIFKLHYLFFTFFLHYRDIFVNTAVQLISRANGPNARNGKKLKPNEYEHYDMVDKVEFSVKVDKRSRYFLNLFVSEKKKTVHVEQTLADTYYEDMYSHLQVNGNLTNWK